MTVSFGSVFSKKNLNLVVGLLSLLVVLWIIMFAVPNLFINLFHTRLGNLILIAFIFLAAMYNINLAIGLSIVFIILFRFMRMGMSIEGLLL
jgi:hypothetical protein